MRHRVLGRVNPCEPMRVRVARPTARLDEIARFYEEGLGLSRRAAFEGHHGYDGIIFALPDARMELEFTLREGARGPSNLPDEHLVLYFDAQDEYAVTIARLRHLGHRETTPLNPWWAPISTTFLDPDGWEVVLVQPEVERADA